MIVIIELNLIRLQVATMFVPIRRDPVVFRESFSDASALQKNVRKKRENFPFLAIESISEIN